MREELTAKFFFLGRKIHPVGGPGNAQTTFRATFDTDVRTQYVADIVRCDELFVKLAGDPQFGVGHFIDRHDLVGWQANERIE